MIISGLREGRWITAGRMRAYARLVVLALLASMAYLLFTAHGLNDDYGRPLGTDFSNIYAGGTYAGEGRAALAFNPETQYAREQAIFGDTTQFYGWHYPPVFLLLAEPLGALPYGVALGLWLGLTGLAYLCCMRMIVPRHDTWLVALGFTAVWVNVTHGHNGFLTAALMGGALYWLPTRPLLAGLLLGCLSYKPQYGLLVPLALLAGGYARAFLAAGLTVVALVAASYLRYGPEVWEAFVQFAPFTRQVVLEQGGTGFYKMQSLFAWVRAWGGSVDHAYAAQGLLMVAVAVVTCWAWRRPMAHAHKAVILVVATLLATPYSLDYDLMVLAPALAFAAQQGLRDGFAPYEKTLLAAVWLLPMALRGIAQGTGLFVMPVMLLLWLGLRLRHARAHPQNMANGQR